MSSTNTDERSIRVISFSGKKTDWDMWEEKFLARARRRGFKQVLVTDPDTIPADLEVLQDTVAAKKDKNRAS